MKKILLSSVVGLFILLSVVLLFFDNKNEINDYPEEKIANVELPMEMEVEVNHEYIDNDDSLDSDSETQDYPEEKIAHSEKPKGSIETHEYISN